MSHIIAKITCWLSFSRITQILLGINAYIIAPIIHQADSSRNPVNFFVITIRLLGPALGVVLFISGSHTISDDARLTFGKWLFIVFLAEAVLYYVLRPSYKLLMKYYIRMCFAAFTSPIKGSNGEITMVSLLNLAELKEIPKIGNKLYLIKTYPWISSILEEEIKRREKDIKTRVINHIKIFLAPKSSDSPEILSLNRHNREGTLENWLNQYLPMISGPWTAEVVLDAIRRGDICAV